MGLPEDAGPTRTAKVRRHGGETWRLTIKPRFSCGPQDFPAFTIVLGWVHPKR